MAVPFAFANLSGNIALSKLDSNFNTPITIGNTSVQLGGTITTLNNMTLSNVTISGGTNNVTETLANVTTLNATSAFITTGNITTANVGNLTLLNALTVPNGGTGMVSLPANNVLLGNGTSPIASVAPGTVGNVLTSTGTGWVSSTVSGGGNAAPNTASYVLISSNANLTSGRVLTAGANVTITDNGPGNTIVINSSGGGGGGGSGTVTSVSVASANGLAGTVANANTTPAITLSTTVTGLLKGNGTAISAATANTDYQSPITLTTTGTSGNATFIANTLNIPQYASGGVGASAWVNFNGDAVTIRGSFNVSSLVRNSTGNYRINFTNTLGSTNYATGSTCSEDLTTSGAMTFIKMISQSATSVNIVSYGYNGSAGDSLYCSIVCFI